MDQPKWLEVAWRELGQREVRGAADNPRIRDYFRDAGHPKVLQDEVPWCAAFVGACLERTGASGTRSLMARSYLAWGEARDEGRLGAVAVLRRGRDPALGHVGFLVGEAGESVLLLGGNQGDAVTVAPFAKSDLLGLRWVASPVPAAPAQDDDGFAGALAHVLEMEGGYSDDPHDPGGPTNKGITLGVLAASRGIVLDARTHAFLKQQLGAISAGEVREIYGKRYWRPSGCMELASGVALMHFDAAVNHGVRTAVQMLQDVAGATIDGEFGPETRAAVLRKSARELLIAYAEARRRRYQRLPHFWRFGRGWLRRVDRTVARALEVAARRNDPSQEKGGARMNGEQTEEVRGKWWPESMTVWGAVVTGLAAVLPALGPAVGLDITGDIVRQAGEQTVQVIQGVGGLIGIVMTIYGRARAARPLERRDVSIRF